MPFISIVIVTWNSRKVLEECVASLFHHVPVKTFELILVDNASQDPRYLDEYSGKANIHVIRNGENLGFSRAVNIGLRQARGDYFLTLNPDIIFTSNPFPRLFQELAKNPKIGAIGPLLCGVDGKPQIRDFYPTLPSIWQFIFYRSLLFKFPPIRRFALRHFHSHVGDTGIYLVDQIPGAFMLFKRQLFKDPVLNESLFIWMEDVDFCLRLKQKGLKAAVLADERITHIGGTSFESWNEPRRLWMFNNSYLTYLEIHLSAPAYLMHTLAMLVNSVAFLVITPFHHARKGGAFVRERLDLGMSLLKLILRRIGRRFLGSKSSHARFLP